MTTEPAFVAFDKIARLNREVIVTEKIDGTNGVVWISDDGDEVRAGSRSRWITPEADNFGFARWVAENAAELRRLGPGYHYGEWWGAGIQRRYGLTEKRFSLFNVHRWADPAVRPACCHVVPELARGRDIRAVVEDALQRLRELGSFAAHGWIRPEGVVAFHTASGGLFKVTLEKDEAPKGARPPKSEIRAVATVDEWGRPSVSATPIEYRNDDGVRVPLGDAPPLVSETVAEPKR